MKNEIEPMKGANAQPVAADDDILNRGGLLSRTFTALKWVLAFCVVADHLFRTGSVIVSGVAMPVESYPGYDLICRFVASFLKNYPVPVFFFISGYLLTPRCYAMPGEFMPTLRRRAAGLLVPFVVWSLIGMAVTLVFVAIHGGGLSLAGVYENGSFSIGGFFVALLGLDGFPTYNVPLWYMRDLFIAIATVPVIHLLLKVMDWRVFLAIAAGVFIFVFRDSRAFRPEVALLFFYAGHLWRHHNVPVLSSFHRVFPYALALYPLLALVHFFLVDGPHDAIGASVRNINIILFVPLAVYGVSRLVKAGWLRNGEFLTVASFVIYVAHYPLVTFFKALLLRSVPAGEGSVMGTMAICVAYVALLVTLLLLAGMLMRFAPRLLRLLTGNR